MKNILLFFFLFIGPTLVQANNVQVTNLTKTGSTITFDLTWENSWFVGISTHDAVWIFVKQAPNGGPSWQHANVSSATVGSGYATEIPTDQVGFFVRRSSTGNGTSSTSVTATLTGLIGTFQDIKVMAIEMVYVPQGSFYAGDGVSNGRIARGDDITEPYFVDSEFATMTCGSTSQDFTYSGGTCEDIPGAFPKGFGALYSMKYAITQQQYADFLNCLGRSQQEARVSADITSQTVTNVYVMSDTPTQVKGSVLRCDATIGYGPITFYCDRNNNEIPNEADDGMSRACNYMRVTDWAAYLDWAGLRPMSFLEVEKISRGPLLPIPDEYSWGSSLWTNNGTLVNAGLENEAWSNSGIDGGISTYSDDVIRVGANAPSTGATRELSNATYYGVIDLGNNPGDWYVGKNHVSIFTREEGDGQLSTSGNANASSWPNFDPSVLNVAKVALQTYGISSLSISGLENAPFGGGRGVRSDF